MTLLRCFVAGIIGLLVGGLVGYAMSRLFISPTTQRLLGRSPSEFEVFVVPFVTVLSAAIGMVGATIAAAESNARSRSTFRVRNLLTLVLSPILAEFVLSITVDSGWGWMIVLHLSTCLGILAGAGSATIFRRAQSPLPKETDSRDVP